MKKYIYTIITALTLLVTFGCKSTQPQKSVEDDAVFTGKSTKHDVIEKWGEPTSKENLDGNEIWTYEIESNLKNLTISFNGDLVHSIVVDKKQTN
jgi:uncharacterized protein YcfL